jgi:Rieske 2Fe-2S family protein
MSTNGKADCPTEFALGANFVPKSRYTDRHFLARELDTVFKRTWLMACREEELHGAGDFVEFTIGDQSIALVRAKSGDIGAFFNACRHRGTRLVSGSGRIGEFRCPFHGWRYGLDGTSTFVLDRENFPECQDPELALVDVRVDTWGGWVFINLDPNAMPLDEYLDPIPACLKDLKLDAMRYKWVKRTPMACNWKTAVDAFIEGYHVAELHPQLQRGDRWNTRPATVEEMAQRARWPTFVHGRHACVRPEIPAEGESGAGEAAIIPQEFVAAMGAYLEDSFSDLKMMSERDLRAARDLKTKELPAGMSPYGYYEVMRGEYARADGLDWPVLSAEELYNAGSDWHIFPNMVILPTQGACLGYRMRPWGLDPDRCLFEAFVLEQVPEQEKSEKRSVEHEFIEDWRSHDDWGTILPQDFSNLERLTAGMHAVGFDGLRLNQYEESTIFNYHKVLDEYLWSASV